MNPVALESTLQHHDLDEAARAALMSWSRPPGLSEEIERIALEVATSRMPAAPAGAPNFEVPRFCRLFAQWPAWDFSAPWLARLSQSWVALANAGDGEEWICELAGRMVPLYDDAPPAVRMACQRLLLALCALLLRAARQSRESERQLAAANDEATGLYRSEQALSQLQVWIKSGQPHGFSVGVLRIAIGPVLLRISAGLQRSLLRQVTARLKRAGRVQDGLFAGGEWEWLILMPGVDDERALEAAMSRFMHVFDSPFDVFGREYRLSAHAGATVFPAGGRDADSLLRSARIALHEALNHGAHFDMFRAEMDHSAARHAQIERGFLEALHEDKLELYLQPQVDAASGQCTQAEALLRWSHAGGHTVAPQFIVEMAQEAGAQHNFARWLTTRAVRTLAEFARRGIGAGLSINLTASDLSDPDLISTISQALALWRVSASRLTIELTESAIIPDEKESLNALHGLRALGCRLAVDDFGTGYSSMAYLRELPLNELKIDQLFVRRMAESEQDREIVRSMLQLAHGLRLEVVAEGVEDVAVAKLLQEMGCQRMQGFLFGQAMPLAQFINWMQGGATLR